MNCPDCHNELKVTDLKGVKIDECVKCKGKWFQRDELRQVKDRQDDHLRWLDFDPFGQDAEKLSVALDGKKCPRCVLPMKALTYQQSKVVIDKCPSCEGVWLAHGELVKIIRYLEHVVSSEPARKLAADTFRQFIEIFRSKEGVVCEIKDFLAVFYLLEVRIGVENPFLIKLSENIYKNTPFK